MKINKNLGLVFLSLVLTFVLASNFASAAWPIDCASGYNYIQNIGESGRCHSTFLDSGANLDGGSPVFGTKAGWTGNWYCDSLDGHDTYYCCKECTQVSSCTKYNWYLDADSDGYYALNGITSSCTSPGNGWTTNTKHAGDCRDNNALVHPSAVETCNNVDDNCNNLVDENLFRNNANQLGLCSGNRDSCNAGSWNSLTSNYVPVAEICNLLDDDCDGVADENDVCNNQTNHTNQTTAPLVFINNPANGFTYNYSNHLLNVNSNQVISNWKYSLNNQANVTFGLGAIINAINGTNTLKVYGTNANGTGMASIVFYINQTGNNNQTNQTNQTVPVITIHSPTTNGNYTSNITTLNVSSNQVVNWIYNINGTNVSAGQSNFLITTLNVVNGTNTLKVYGTNANGTGAGTVTFIVKLSSDKGNDDDKNDGDNKVEEDCLLSSMPYELSYESDVLNNQTITLTPKKAIEKLDIKFWLYWAIIAVLVLLIILIIVYIARVA